MDSDRPAPPPPPDPSSGSSGRPDAPGTALPSDWPATATDAIVNAVDAVRDRTTGPIMTIARALVFGVFALSLGITVITLLVIATIHFLDEVLPFSVWLPYLVLGAALLVVGGLVFSRRMAPGNTTAR